MVGYVCGFGGEERRDECCEERVVESLGCVKSIGEERVQVMGEGRWEGRVVSSAVSAVESNQKKRRRRQ